MLSKIKSFLKFESNQQRKVQQYQTGKSLNKQIFNIKFLKVSPVKEDQQEAVVLNQNKKEDLRKQIESTFYPFSCIGLLYVQFSGTNHLGLEIQEKGYGTAFLIQHNIVLTAAHNIYSRKHKLNANMVLVTFGMTGKKYQTFQIAYGFIPKKYKSQRNQENKYENDYAVLILDTKEQLVNKFSCLSILKNYQQIKQSGQIFIFGFPQDLNIIQNLKQNQDKNMITRMFGSSQNILKLKKNIIYHNVDTNIGQSGSPILIKQNSQYKVIGIHNGGSNNINHGSRISLESISNINRWVRQFYEDSQQRLIFIEKNRLITLDKFLYQSNIQRTKNRIKLQKFLNPFQRPKSLYKEFILVTLLGDNSVGKTSLLQRFISDRFTLYSQPTLGACYGQKKFQYSENQTIQYRIWDTAGQQKYNSVASIYYRSSHVAICVFDTKDKNSFSIVKNWVQQLKIKGPSKIIIAIAGTKIDLQKQQQQQQNTLNKEAEQYAQSINAIFQLTSAKQNIGIKELFTKIALKFEQVYS